MLAVEVDSRTVLDAFRQAESGRFRQTVGARGRLQRSAGVGRLSGRLVSWVQSRPGREGSFLGRKIKFLLGNRFGSIVEAMRAAREASANNAGALLAKSEIRHAGLAQDLGGKEALQRQMLERINTALRFGNFSVAELGDVQRELRHLAQSAQSRQPQRRQATGAEAKPTGASSLQGAPISPEVAAKYLHKIQFDGLGRIQGFNADLSRAELDELSAARVPELTQTNTTAQRETARTTTESMIQFMHLLEHLGGEPAAELLAAAKQLWTSGPLDEASVAAYFTDAAARPGEYPGARQLALDLLEEAKAGKPYTQLFDNVFGRKFEAELAHYLVRNPPARTMQALSAFGNAVYQNLLKTAQKGKQELVDRHLKQIAMNIEEDPRPWYAETPCIRAFIEEPSLENFKEVLTVVDTGFDIVKITKALAVFSLKAPGILTPWMFEANQNYCDVVMHARGLVSRPARFGISSRMPVKDRAATDTTDYGPRLQYHPHNKEYAVFYEGESVADRRTLALHQSPDNPASEFVLNALRQGRPVSTGASGITNILAHLAEFNQGITPKEHLYLASTISTVFDGGHSVHETLGVWQALQDQQPPATTDEEQYAIASERCRSMEEFSCNYNDLLQIAETAGVRDDFEQALNNAFDKTVDFFGKHATSAQENRAILAQGQRPAAPAHQITVAGDAAEPAELVSGIPAQT